MILQAGGGVQVLGRQLYTKTRDAVLAVRSTRPMAVDGRATTCDGCEHDDMQYTTDA